MTSAALSTAGSQRGIAELVLVRHGESIGNVADRAAIAAKAHRLDLAERDADVPLSEDGRAQADALAEHLSGLGADALPTVVVSSPYRRARETAERVFAQRRVDVLVDERIRERELGIFDGVTWYGIAATHPEESERRRRIGKFYYRPPGGESWCDVVLRVRSILVELQQRFAGERVWLFSHEAVILAFRYVLESLDEAHVVALQHDEPLANCSLTRYVDADGALTLVARDDTDAVEADPEAPVTREPGHAPDPAAAGPEAS